MTDKKPLLLFVAGLPGSGKTTLAQTLVKNTKFVYLDKDIIQDQFTYDRKNDEYQKIKKSTYNVFYKLAEANLRLGNSVILDAPFCESYYFGEQDWENFIETLTKDSKADIKVIWCFLDEKKRIEYIKKRNHMRDIPQMKKYKTQKNKFPSIKFQHIFFDSSNGNLQKIFDFLK